MVLGFGKRGTMFQMVGDLASPGRSFWGAPLIMLRAT